MTQHQAQQRRLGQYPAFQSFLDFLGTIPENDHPQAWEQMYSLLLPEKAICCKCDRPAEWSEKYCQDHWEEYCSSEWWKMLGGES